MVARRHMHTTAFAGGGEETGRWCHASRGPALAVGSMAGFALVGRRGPICMHRPRRSIARLAQVRLALVGPGCRCSFSRALLIERLRKHCSLPPAQAE